MRLAQLEVPLESGTCLFGGENVRTYPVQVRTARHGWTSPTTRRADPAPLFASLLEAMERRTWAGGPDTLRLRRIGTPLAEIVRESVHYGAPRGVRVEPLSGDAGGVPELAAMSRDRWLAFR